MSREGKAKIVSDKELKRVKIILKDGRHAERNSAMVDFSFLLGLRAKEMASLKVADVVTADGSIKDAFYLKANQTKGKKGREIYLTNKTLRKSLKQYLTLREGDRCQWLFANQKGGHFDANTLQQTFTRFFKKAGLDGCSSHSGRRTFATRLINKGFDIKSVSLLMGHSSIQTTAKYIQENPQKMSQMIASL